MSRRPKRHIKKLQFKSEKELPQCSISLASTLYNKTGSWRSIRPVIDYTKCTSCAICWKFCPEPAIFLEGEKITIDYDYCKGCGICIEACPRKAIKYEKERK